MVPKAGPSSRSEATTVPHRPAVETDRGPGVALPYIGEDSGSVGQVVLVEVKRGKKTENKYTLISGRFQLGQGKEELVMFHQVPITGPPTTEA